MDPEALPTHQAADAHTAQDHAQVHPHPKNSNNTLLESGSGGVGPETNTTRSQSLSAAKGQGAEGAEEQEESPYTRENSEKRHNSRGRGGGNRGDRGGRSFGNRGDRQGKKGDMGRNQWSNVKVDKRQRNDQEQAAKRRRVDRGDRELPVYATKFSDEVLQAEERRPKKKVAVLIGYAGTGYRGMQLAHDQKTIEGDLFQAFVAAGAISKANADDPKKSSFVRCARTDKGVHAAGNVISLKLIVEDDDIVQKINEQLVSQIRVWGLERTSNSFSAYQMVDSRIYEYLIPTHSFLPPHPSSFLGKKLAEWAEREDDTEAWKTRQEEVTGYWEKVDEEQIKPILDTYDSHIRSILEKALYLHGDDMVKTEDKEQGREASNGAEPQQEKNAETGNVITAEIETEEGDWVMVERPDHEKKPHARLSPVTQGIKKLRQAYITARRTYRIPEARLKRVQDLLNMFCGTKNFHNYTIMKTYRDPSSKRVIKSFKVNPHPIIIDGTEWLSLKVHGQSFMMHQIRKMVGMVALMVRSGCNPVRMAESFGPENISIPKAPSLGLLLERPVFDTYNRKATNELSRDAIDFDKYRKEMDEFKQREIYDRMYRDEEKENVFGNFFNHIDNFPSEVFLFITSGGFKAVKEKIEGLDNGSAGQPPVDANGESEDEGPNDANGNEG